MRSLLVIILFFFSGKLISQETAKEMDLAYGLDPLLYNGKIYTYFLPAGTGGNQFFLSTDYFLGEVTIKGKLFEGITLNYDIYNQQLLLQYAGETGAFNIIEISKAWLESFSIGPMNFKFITHKNESRIYQVLGDGPLHILYYWRKNLKLSNSAVAADYTFSLPIRTNFVMIKGESRPYGSIGSFIKLFDPVHKDEIKDYIHVNGIKLKKAPDQVMTDLINFISNLD